MGRAVQPRLHSIRGFQLVCTRRAAARVLAPAVQVPRRQDAVQSHGRVDDAVLRDDRRAGGGPRARVVSRDAPRPPSRAQSSRVGARDGAGEPRRDGEWTRGSGGTPAGGPRDRYRFLDLLPQESPWFVDGRVPREGTRGDRRAGVRGAGRDHRRAGRCRRPRHRPLAPAPDPHSMSLLDTPLSRQVGIDVPLICGAMYPCTNPELVAAVSAAGGIDVLIERSSKLYVERMHRYLDVALEEGVRFFVTSLGNPRWVVDRVVPLGGIVYHDVTERKWAEKGLAGGVHGLIAVNDRAGGHAGPRSAQALYDELADLGVPIVCAGGIGDEAGFVAALQMGYAGAQLGTRFIATVECGAHDDYKQAIVRATEDDIVLTERVTGVPLAVIRTPYVERIGTKAGPIARWLLRGRRTKHWMRTIYALRSAWQLKRASLAGGAGEKTSKDYWQAGKSVAWIHAIEPAGEIVRRFAAAAKREGASISARPSLT